MDRSALHGPIRERVVAALRAQLGEAHGVVLLQGGGPFPVYTTDGELIFKQVTHREELGVEFLRVHSHVEYARGLWPRGLRRKPTCTICLESWRRAGMAPLIWPRCALNDFGM